MIINKIESKLIKSVSVTIGIFVLQIALITNSEIYTHLQAQLVFGSSVLIQVISSLSACFFLGWFLLDKVIGKTQKTSVSDINFGKQAEKKKAA
jgi:hypothetical protein